jgi:hypothetical protein
MPKASLANDDRWILINPITCYAHNISVDARHFAIRYREIGAKGEGTQHISTNCPVATNDALENAPHGTS